ncbi:MAG: hypothetical protein M0P97_03370 [Candidatus Moranbacteria bacterium]|jgi:hypothetical protein|nr:hypothetical protein [Candidatus Moranbacteria bacterium]
MRKDKDIAVKLRKQGLSYNQISEKIKIPKSTLSYWLKDLEISEKAKNKIKERVNETAIKALIKRNKEQTKIASDRADIIRKEAKEESKKLFKNKLFIAGVSLYWAEGYKKGAYGSKWKSVDFANSDPEMIKVMMKFFREICRVENKNIRLQIIAHRNVNIESAVTFWSKKIKIPKDQFMKTYCSYPEKESKRKNHTLTNGTLHIRINNVKLFFRIIGWIDGFKTQLMGP